MNTLCTAQHEHGTPGAAAHCDRERQPSGYTLTQEEFRKRKTALTRAINGREHGDEIRNAARAEGDAWI